MKVENNDSKNPKQLAILAAKTANNCKAKDIMVLEIGAITDIADFFVIVTARNIPQVEYLLETIVKKLKVDGHIQPFSREGTKDRSWEILDYGQVVINIFQPEAREYYRLENLWGDAPLVNLEEVGIKDLEYSERIAKLIALS